MYHQCENCDTEYDERDSDAIYFDLFCCRDCEQEREEKILVFDDDFDFILDHDHSMDH